MSNPSLPQDPSGQSVQSQGLESSPGSFGLLITRDLMFTSKVTSTANALRLKIDVISTVGQLRERVSQNIPKAVFIDLSLTDLNVRDVVATCASSSSTRLIAFGSHVDEGRLNEALDAGCHEVLPRSRFSATLPDLLKKSFGEAE